MGRHKLTPKRHEIIVSAISKGHYDTTAASMAGISDSTLRKWIAKGVEEDNGIYYDLAVAVEAAKAKGESFLVGNVINAVDKGDWRAAAWILERKYFERWRKRGSMEVTGSNGGPVELTAVSEEKVIAAYQARLDAAKHVDTVEAIESDPMFE